MPDDSYSIKEFITHTIGDMKEKIDLIHNDVQDIKSETAKSGVRMNTYDLYFRILWWGIGSLCTMILIFFPLFWDWFKNDQRMTITKSVDDVPDSRIESIEIAK